jgi:phage shock protein C
MYCNSCGKAIAEDARFCAHCGNVVGNSHAARKLFRSRTDRKIAGVCAGLGHYLDLDTSLVRILWVLVTFAFGFFPGLIAYIVAWIIVPEDIVFSPIAAENQPVAS